ncbi:helix-turn-helix domain-containing protein [Mesorhizobium sp. M0166]
MARRAPNRAGRQEAVARRFVGRASSPPRQLRARQRQSRGSGLLAPTGPRRGGGLPRAGRSHAGGISLDRARAATRRAARPLVDARARDERRTLRRRFDESFGYGPKTLDRILRYQRFLRLSSHSNSSTAMLAAEAGYSDQAHLVRESRRLTGGTPRQIHHLLHNE